MVPLLSLSTALSTHLEFDGGACAELPLPLTPCCGSAGRTGDACSHIFTVRSKEEDAMMDPNSGWAQLTFDTGAS